MFVAEKATGHLIEVLDTQALFDPHVQQVRGSLHYGEEAQDPESFAKSDLAFPSGEALPVCAGCVSPELRELPEWVCGDLQHCSSGYSSGDL